MTEKLHYTGERFLPGRTPNRETYLMYLRHLFAYELAEHELAGSEYVLDVGCGEGYGTHMLARSFGRVVGMDVDRAAVEQAVEKYGSSDCMFQRYDGSRLPLGDGELDAVVSFQVIEHVPRHHLFVSEIYRILKAGGRLILTTPNAANRLTRPGARPWNRFHLREYTSGELYSLLSPVFGKVRVAGISASPEVHAIEMARVSRSRWISKLDPLSLHRMLPDRLRTTIVPLISRMIRPGPSVRHTEDHRTKYSTNDFFVTDVDIDNALDLLCICTKGPL